MKADSFEEAPNMLGLGWLTMRQAEEAIATGRLEEAHRLLMQPEMSGHKGASVLLQQVASKFIERGRQHLELEDAGAAWHDLGRAEDIGACAADASRLRQALTRRSLDEARQLLEAGEPARALEALERVRQRGASSADAQLLEEACKSWIAARDQAAKGEFGLAAQHIDRVQRVLSRRPATLERFRLDLADRRPAATALAVQLHEAWAAERWRDVVRVAEQLLALAPQHAEARRARARAWKALEPAAPPATVMAKDSRDRFLLWVDGAGGFLVCLASRVTIGQAAPDAFVDIPLLADVSRTHAALTRDAEGYLLEASRAALVNGKPAERILLQPEDRITLGKSCQIQFRQPVPVSATARLDLVSGHRLPLSVDGVLLMAETLVLGPGPQAHVVVPELQEPIVLFRQKDGLGVRCPGNWTINGEPVRDRGMLGERAQVRGDDFSFAVEPVGAVSGRL
jgi:hypothetical protein